MFSQTVDNEIFLRLLGGFSGEFMTLSISGTGRGTIDTTVTFGFKPEMVIVFKHGPFSQMPCPRYQAVFALADLPGATYAPRFDGNEVDYIHDGVVCFTEKGIVLGTNPAVNEAGKKYTYWGVGRKLIMNDIEAEGK